MEPSGEIKARPAVACVVGVSKSLHDGNETERKWEKKTHSKETKLRRSAKNKEQREGVRREKETPTNMPRSLGAPTVTWKPMIIDFAQHGLDRAW